MGDAVGFNLTGDASIAGCTFVGTDLFGTADSRGLFCENLGQDLSGGSIFDGNAFENTTLRFSFCERFSFSNNTVTATVSGEWELAYFYFSTNFRIADNLFEHISSESGGC